MAGDVHQLFLCQSALSHVFRIQEHHSPSVVDAAIAIVIAVDGGIELVVGADAGQHELSGLHGQGLDLADGEFGFAARGTKLALFGRDGGVESALVQAFVEILEAGDNAGNLLAQVAIVACVFASPGAAEQSVGDAGDDRGLTLQR